MILQTTYTSAKTRIFGLIAALACLLACSVSVHAAGLTVIFVDGLGLSAVYDTAHGPLAPNALAGAVVGLMSPGLPRGTNPQANLYATLSAGDVANTSNSEDGLLFRQLAASGADRTVQFIHYGSVDRPGRMAALRALIQRLRINGAKTRAPGILLVGVTPPPSRVARVAWDSLTPVLWLTCGNGSTNFSLQPTFTSDTTQTQGLIALRDIAPTILAAEDVPIPDSMSGHPAHMVILGAGHSRDALLMRMDRLTRLNEDGVAPFGWIFGLGGGCILLTAIWAVLKRRNSAARPLRYLLRALLGVPVALMIAPLAPAPSVWLYLAEIAFLAALLGVIPRIQWLLFLSVGAMLADALCGTPLISRSLISAYWLSGIRFYGIGNEYMGIIIGMTLVAPFVAERKASVPETPLRPSSLGLLALWFAASLTILAYPQYGAKAGGAVTAMAGFATCWWAAARRKTPGFWIWCVALALGVASVFALAALAEHFGSRATHIQAATDAVAHGHWRDAAHIALRKAKMAVKIALAPGAFVGLVGLGIVGILWMRSALRSRVQDFLSGRPNLRRALVAGLWAMLAALLFNDSGAVAALLLFGALALSLLHEMLGEMICVLSPSMSGMSASESPSATSLN